MKKRHNIGSGENKMVTDSELAKVFAFANFGSMTHREVVRLGVLKCASGFHQGHTSRTILVQLGLITDKYRLTQKGKEYLWEAFRNGSIF